MSYDDDGKCGRKRMGGPDGQRGTRAGELAVVYSRIKAGNTVDRASWPSGGCN